MVTTAESSSNHHSPTSTLLSVGSGDCNNPKFPRKNLPSPWAHVVRGGDPESTTIIHQSPLQPTSSSCSSFLTTSAASSPDQPTSSDSSPKAVDNPNTVAAATDNSDANNGNAGHSKKPAWNKPSNGLVEAGPVMGAESWPALSESTKASGKLPADSSSKTAADGSLSTSQGPVTSHFPQKQATSNAKPYSATNYNMPNRQRLMKRTGGSSVGSGPAQSSFSNPPSSPPPPFPVYQLPSVSYGNVVPGIPDPSPRDHFRNNNWDSRPPSGGFVPVMNEHRDSSRRGNFGPHPRGDGSSHNNYGSRRDQDRGNYANTRDAHVHQPRMPSPRGLLRHPPPNTAAAFVGPQPIGPFANPIGFPEFYYIPTVTLEHFRGLPFFTHSPPPAMFFPPAESPLTNMIVNQIDYYFSDANLVKDEFLRSNMDEQGWVPITLIANFPRVRSLTSNIQLILESLRTSTVVEVQGDKLRRHNEWRRWLPSAQLRSDSGSMSPGGSRYNNLAADFQTITLEEATEDEGPTESSIESQLPNGGDAPENSN